MQAQQIYITTALSEKTINVTAQKEADKEKKKRDIISARLSVERPNNTITLNRVVDGNIVSFESVIHEILSHTGDPRADLSLVRFMVMLQPIADNVTIVLPWLTIKDCSSLTDYEVTSKLMFREATR
jgi:hypothetical protein